MNKTIGRARQVYVPLGNDEYTLGAEAKADPKLRAKALKALNKEYTETEQQLHVLRNTIDYLQTP